MQLSLPPAILVNWRVAGDGGGGEDVGSHSMVRVGCDVRNGLLAHYNGPTQRLGHGYYQHSLGLDIV